MANLLMGIDLGTSGCKTIIIDEYGNIISSNSQLYNMANPRPSWAEQDPLDWWEATVKSIQISLADSNVSPRDIDAIGLTGQMHGLVILNEHNDVIRPCIMWNDQRSSLQCRNASNDLGLENIIKLTGNQILPGFMAPKIKWVAENEPDNYRKINHILLPKDYIRFKLSGEHFSDVSDASGTSLFDVRSRKWSEEMIEYFEVKKNWLPITTESPVISSYVSEFAANETGLLKGTPIIGGAGDQAAQAVGAGIINEGDTSVTLGTSGVVFSVSDFYKADPNGILHAFCHAVPGKWHLMGVMLSAAGSLKWYRDNLGEIEIQKAKEIRTDPYDLLTKEASLVPPGSEGLIFLPYLSGERTPYPNPNARGVFFGLSLRHSKNHLIRSVLEGVAYGLRDSIELMTELKINIDKIIASGGGARSDFWLQIISNVFGREIIVNNSVEGASLGAALLAGVGVEVFSGFQEASSRIIDKGKFFTPDNNRNVYEDFYTLYKSLYFPLKPLFDFDNDLVTKYL